MRSAKFVVIVLVMANARVKRAAYNQTDRGTDINLRKGDRFIQTNTSSTPDDFARAEKNIRDNEISNDIVTQVDSQTPSVTLLFLNASYTIADTKERLSVENSTVYETMSLTQAQTTVAEQLAPTQPDQRKRVTKLSKTYQRGILDLLFPAARLMTFKAYLEALKRFLSATF